MSGKRIRRATIETNLLYYGDNLDVLRRHIPSESVDLVYLDPPFKSNVDYNVLFSEQDGTRSAAQVKAFTDTWRWDQEAADAYQESVESGGDVAEAMRAFRTFLGGTDMLAYLAMMAPRLKELHRVLRPTGSIYLHCDPTASHYLKLLMDAVFSPRNFCNEIIWHYRKWPSGRYTYQRNHDVILFYSKSQDRGRVFNYELDPMARAPSTLKRFGTSVIVSGHDAAGERVPSQTKDEVSAGVRRDDVWDIGRVPPIKQLYPTEKPLALLERIIRFSTEKEQVLLDPFCGCGTAIVAASGLGRRWIGIDITHLSVGLIKHRLVDLGGPAAAKGYQVVGEPTDLAGAERLAADDPFQFQAWALGLVGARVAGSNKKGADKGIDGKLYFHDEGPSGKSKQIIFSVKAGNTGRAHVHELRGVMEREGAEIGCLISMQTPTRPMREDAASAGIYASRGIDFRCPKIQLLTVEGLLEAKEKLEYPSTQGNVTFRRAQRTPPKAGEQEQLFERDR
ncbi:MAG TPA: DNA methyltransferase [Candidatus Micrarchaeaceae archaeon]|nr:DNA methyltransferase [Candidatus Micrarchaeaceae archaeon]